MQSRVLRGRCLFGPCVVGTQKSCVAVMPVAQGVMLGLVLTLIRSSSDAERLMAKASVRM
jgi:hypothetical protein